MYGAIKPPPHASHYSPKFVPGARLPHAWVKILNSSVSSEKVGKHNALPREPVDVSYVKELSKKEVESCQWSTLDLCGPDSWTLILGRDQLLPRLSSLENHCDSIGLGLNVWRLGGDFELTKKNVFEDELSNGGGILIRPDQHIIMRVTSHTTGDDMLKELRGHLGV